MIEFLEEKRKLYFSHFKLSIIFLAIQRGQLLMFQMIIQQPVSIFCKYEMFYLFKNCFAT
jgi:hypothetical protein